MAKTKKARQFPSVVHIPKGDYLVRMRVGKHGRVLACDASRWYSDKPIKVDRGEFVSVVELRDASPTAQEGIRRLLQSPQPVIRR